MGGLDLSLFLDIVKLILMERVRVCLNTCGAGREFTDLKERGRGRQF